MRRGRSAATIAVAVWAALVAGQGIARAEVGLVLPPVSDEASRGFRFGEFILIPELATQGAYTYNMFRQDPREGRSDAGQLVIRPGFRLDNPNPSNFQLTWDGNAGLNFYFSSDQNAKRLARFSAGTTMKMEILPKSVFGLFVLDSYLRELMPRNYSSPATFDRNFNHAEAGFTVRPGGGALQISASYAFNLDMFDQFSEGDVFYHQVRLLTTWDFFPKTTFLIDADWRYTSWRHELEGLRNNSMPLRAVAGVKGYVTKKIALTVKAGYGQGFYRSGQDVKTFIGEASLGFKFTPYTLLEAGYDRDFTDSFWARWYIADSAYLKFGQQLWERLNLELGARYSYVQYASFDPKSLDPTTTTVPNETDRRDHALVATASISCSIARWVAVKVGYQMYGIFTKFQIDSKDTSGKPSVDYGGYVQHQVFGELSLLY